MAGLTDTLVFVPAWNEEESLPAVLDELGRELPQADVLVVDDGSTDQIATLHARPPPTRRRATRSPAPA